MSAPNLFSQLERYARENFTTELLAYALRTDKAFLSQFLRLFLNHAGDGAKTLKMFRTAEISTQSHYKNSIIDLEIVSRLRQDERIFIEIKTDSDESDGQIQKYLKLPGYVAYLTPLGYPSPSVKDVNGTYLGHFTWNEVCSLLRSTSGRKGFQKEFIKYLEARDMGELQPVKNTELKRAAAALEFITKSQSIIQKVQRAVAEDWSKNFKRNFGSKSANPGFSYGDAYSWWYRARSWKRGRLYLELGIAIRHTPDNTPAFFVAFGASSKKLRKYLETELCHTLQKLQKADWVLYPDEWGEWGYRKYFELGTGQVDEIAKRNIAHTRSSIRELGKVHLIKRMKEVAKKYA